MPKISEATVAEHRARQESALLAAAEELLLSDGPRAVTLRAVGERIGLARSSMYEYVSSNEDLLGAVVEAAFVTWAASVTGALSGVTDPAAAVEEYVRATLRRVGDRDHRALAAVGRLELPESRRARIAALHEDLLRPLIEALVALGVEDPQLTARLLQGIVDAATREIDRGAAVEPVAERAVGLVRGALARPRTAARRR